MADNELPEGWTKCKLKDVLNRKNEKWSPDDGGDHRYLSLKHIEKDSGQILGHGFSSEVDSSKNIFAEGDVLYGKLRPYLNKVAQPSFDGICSTDVLVFESSPLIHCDFLKHRLRATDVVEYADQKSSGINLPRISPDDLGEFEIGLPPLSEQRRIADRLDAIQSRAEKTGETINQVPDRIEEYRQSVLNAAFTGRLTADWREDHPDVEPGAQLLSEAEDKRTNKYKKRGKISPSDEGLTYEIPNSWTWAQIGDVASHIRYGTSDKAKYENSGIPMIRMGDIEDGQIHFDDLKYMSEDWEDREKFLLEDGDLLFNRTNSAELVGKSAVYKAEHPEAVFASYLVRAKLHMDIFAPDLLARYINSAHGRRYIRAETKQQVGQANVNATKMASMPIPVPPAEEQEELFRRIKQRLDKINEMADHVEQAGIRLDQLDRSALAKAFRGELVETEAERARREDRDYETAEELLERVQGESSSEGQTASSEEQTSTTTQVAEDGQFEMKVMKDDPDL